ncbi:hypothetical protein B0H19DRAFT_1264573 [Mycena capillaripes]|nr:hypothetical protein B0H19DRAFT_1264573 [Mycena capillaripes]
MNAGLTISALVSAVHDELPLYQAIIVTDLMWLAHYAIFTALATCNRHLRGSPVVQYAVIDHCTSRWLASSTSRRARPTLSRRYTGQTVLHLSSQLHEAARRRISASSNSQCASLRPFSCAAGVGNCLAMAPGQAEVEAEL